MYRPCLHCEGKRYDESYCPEICTYGEDRKRLKELEVLYAKDIAEAKAEAIKEFAERLKDYGTLPDLPWDIWKTFADSIDNLVKEMVGEDK